jgi:hypothetical protein
MATYPCTFKYGARDLPRDATPYLGERSSKGGPHQPHATNVGVFRLPQAPPRSTLARDCCSIPFFWLPLALPIPLFSKFLTY